MPSLVRVTNLDNGRALVVRINDRGPFKPGRIIDLSRRSAQLLGVDRVGTAKVRVEILAEESRQLAALARRKPGAEDEVIAAAPAGPIKTETLQPPPGVQATQANPPPASARPQPAPAPQVAAASPPAPTGEVQVVPVKPTGIFVQAGSFTNFTNADRLSKNLAAVAPARVEQTTVGKQVFWRVRVGPAMSVEEADQIMSRVAAAGYPEARVFVE